MKNIFRVSLLLSCLTTVLYSQEISEKEGKKVLEQIRREVQAEEKKGKKIIEDIRKDMNESLEEKVFRGNNTQETRMTAVKAAFENGRKRMVFLKMEEEEIMKLEKKLGIKPDENRVFLSQEFEKVYDDLNFNNNNIETLLFENKKLNECLCRLEKMEQKIGIKN